jgi:hypothetical protein
LWLIFCARPCKLVKFNLHKKLFLNACFATPETFPARYVDTVGVRRTPVLA